MMDINKKLYKIRLIDDLGAQESVIHRINPTIKLITTFLYIIKVLSLKDFVLMDIAIIIAYPLILFILGNIPIRLIFGRLILILPVIIGVIGVNLIIDFSYNQIMLALLLIFKCVFSVVSTLLLITTTTMNNITRALRRLKVPKILVMQIAMLYRYIILMMEEAYKIKCAYELRTMDKKSMNIKHFGEIMGQMLLRSIARAEDIYKAMKLRGFEGEYYTNTEEKLKVADYIYLGIFIGTFILV